MRNFKSSLTAFLFSAGIIGASVSSCAQPLNNKTKLTRQDTLRGTITPERAWWDLKWYRVDVKPDYKTKTIEGSVSMRIEKLSGNTSIMQIDLQEPMLLDSAYYLTKNKTGGTLTKYVIPFHREGNVFWLETKEFNENIKSEDILRLYYHGKPREATNPPWDGGWIWKTDDKGSPWMSVACQGLGASVWYPCKDHQSDEPESGATLSITVVDTLSAIGNGRMVSNTANNDGTRTWVWKVTNPINNYNLVPYIGKYASWHEEYSGEKGKLDLDFWVLESNLEKAKKHFAKDVKPMLKSFEYWFGPYPFYEDGYKLVESPHLGMEHQSSIAYGNKYVNGYLTMDLSGSGWGKDWDYIIVHESGHEWFGNNITTRDIADMWIHEGFTDYSETLFVESKYGKEAATAYTVGLRNNIENDIPVIGIYGVNQEGSGDMYYKGNNLIHTIRQVINDDVLFRNILRGLNKDFYHQTVTSKDVENYFIQKSGKDLSKIFDQYLRTTKIPILEYSIETVKAEKDSYVLNYKWANVIEGFEMPVTIQIDGKSVSLEPSTGKKTLKMKGKQPKDVKVAKEYYVVVRRGT
jgi:aminopeptidase N